MKVNVKIKRLSEDAVIPKYAHEGDAGFDIVASEDVIIEPGETKIVPTGLAIALPPGYEAQIRPRSGITVKTKLRVQLGTIDAGYNGEIGIIVDNIAPIVFETVKDEEGKRFESFTSSVIYDIKHTFVKTDGEYIDGAYLVRKGDRLAQIVINQVEQVQFSIVEELDKTERGAGGFGSSGVTS
ncbi:dUTP diphosphatase [Priestia megaterium]|uniref:dUTP diphosphatase n=1 Tax=Priestia megaterium TaxID=1404 RepID=UPI00345A9910